MAVIAMRMCVEKETTSGVSCLQAAALEKKTNTIAVETLHGHSESARALKDGPLQNHIIVVQDAACGLDGLNTLVTAVSSGSQNGNLQEMSFAYGPSQVANGILNVQVGFDEIKAAHKNDDDIGLATGLIRVPRGVVDVARGGTSVVQTGLQIANKAPAVVTALGSVASIGSGFCTVVVGATAMMNISETLAISSVLSKTLKEQGEDRAFSYLKSLLSITEQDKTKVLDEIFTPQKNSWSRKAKSYLIEKFVGAKASKEDIKLKEMIQKGATRELLETYTMDNTEVYPQDILEKIEKKLIDVTPNYTQLSESHKQKLIGLVCGLYGKGLKNTQDKKEIVFERTIGSDTKKLLQPFMVEQEVVIPAKITEIITCAKQGLRGNAIRQSLALAACTVSMAVMTLAYVFTGGVYFFIQLAINLVLSAVWLGLDGYYLYKSYAETHALMKDKVLMLIVTVAMVFAASLVSALMESTLNLVLTLSFCVISLAFAIYGIYTWNASSSRG